MIGLQCVDENRRNEWISIPSALYAPVGIETINLVVSGTPGAAEDEGQSSLYCMFGGSDRHARP